MFRVLFIIIAIFSGPSFGKVQDSHFQRFKQRGYAAWYHKKFQNRRTASGERYNMNGMTAAHRTLPFHSYVRVTNLRNGRQVTVRINDRGPFDRRKIIDLSTAAANKLGLSHRQAPYVLVERIR